MSTLRERIGWQDAGPNSAMPIYLRLREAFKSAIQRGDLQPCDALPGERDLAVSFNVSRVTIRKALSGLVESGLLNQRQGSGTYVCAGPNRVEQALSRLTSFSDDMRLRGLEPSVVWLKREISHATPRQAMRLSLSPNETMCRLKRLRLANGTPMAIETAVVSTRHLSDPYLVENSLYAVLEIDRLSFLDNGAPLEFTHSWYRGDAYDFVAELTLRTTTND